MYNLCKILLCIIFANDRSTDRPTNFVRKIFPRLMKAKIYQRADK